jgi:pimeloyl-ACP methyl ester carboxylesterase
MTKYSKFNLLAEFQNFLISPMIQTLFISLILYMSLQEIFVPPSRISTVDLCRKFHLPSAISKYEQVSLDLNGATKKIGVHYLNYPGTKYTGAGLFGAVYVHHGFGASSLSWLPTLPSLVDRLGARFGLGHDMVGFGFTDRQEELEWYTTDASARISRSIFDNESCVNGNPIPSVVLLGHSLGAIGVLKMALQLPMGLSKVIILSSPALGLTGNFPPEPGGDIVPGPSGRLMDKVSAFIQKYLVFPIGGYVLRRLVG